MLNRILSYQSLIFKSFDELVDYIDNLGDDDILISKIRGYTPLIFLNKNISVDDYKNVEIPGLIPGLYKEPDKHPFRQITYRAKDKGYELDVPLLKAYGAYISYPSKSILYENWHTSLFHFPHDGVQAFELGIDYRYSNDDKEVFVKHGSYISPFALLFKYHNYFKLQREFRMSGLPFATGNDYIKVGFDFFCNAVSLQDDTNPLYK